MVVTSKWSRPWAIASTMLLSILLLSAALGQYYWLSTMLERQVRETLNQRWAALQSYLRVQPVPQTDADMPVWFYDREDPAQAALVNDIQRIYLLTDRRGQVIQHSILYEGIGFDSPAAIQPLIKEARSPAEDGPPIWTVKRDAQGTPFLIRAGIVFGTDRRTPYYAAIGAPLSQVHQSLQILMGMDVALLLIALLLGWILGQITPSRSLGVARTW